MRERGLGYASGLREREARGDSSKGTNGVNGRQPGVSAMLREVLLWSS